MPEDPKVEEPYTPTNETQNTPDVVETPVFEAADSTAPTDTYLSEPVNSEVAPEVEAAPVESTYDSFANTEPQPVIESAPISTPTPEPVVMPTSMPMSAPEPTQPKKRRKALLIGAIIAGTFVLLSATSASAYFFWYQNPNKVVGDALVNALTAKTISATGSLDMEFDKTTIKIEASGRNSLEANSTLAVKATITSEGTTYTVDGEGIYSSEGDFYVKLNDAQKLVDSFEKQSGGAVSFNAFDGVIKKIDGNWIKISKDDLGDFSEDYKKTQTCFADISKSLDSDAAFRKTVQSETETLYKEHQFLTVGDSLGSRAVNGQDSLGYVLSADTDTADAFFTGFGKTQLGTKIKACDSDIAFEDFVTEENNSDSSSKSDTQIWVSRFGHTITEVNSKAEAKDGKGTFVINPVFNKNEPVGIPKSSISLSELKADIEAAYEDLYASYDYSATTPSDSAINYN